MKTYPRVVGSFFTASFLAFALVGCSGGAKGSLSGTVQYKGKPVVGATVTVYDADKKPFQASVIDGRYSINGITAGPIEIIVTSPNPNETAGRKDPEGSRSGRRPNTEAKAPETPAAPVAGWFPIPSKYADTKSTPLKFTLKAGHNDYDINLAD